MLAPLAAAAEAFLPESSVMFEVACSGGVPDRFMRAVQEVLLTKQVLSEADLYEPPLTNFGRNAVERLFPREQIENLLAFADGLTA